MNVLRRSIFAFRRAGALAWPAVAVLLAGCVGNVSRTSTPTPTPPVTTPAIAVSVSPTAATVQVGAMQAFTATVSNDSQSKGVTWALSGASCGPPGACGTLSGTSSASGAAVMYTAPTSLPSSPTITLAATSVADNTKSAAVAVTLTAPSPAISVNVSPSTASVQVGGTQMFSAILQNDSQNKGVSWTLSGASCTGSACGTVSPTSSVSGAPVTYTAPPAAPSGPVTLTATSVADSTKSSAAAIIVNAPPAIMVTLSPTIANVQAGGATQAFTATLQNDSLNQGITWSLSGTGCRGATCGTVLPTSSVSGVAVTYTSPGQPPTPATITLTATSVANAAVSASATISLTGPPAPTPSSPLLLGHASISQGYGDPVVETDAAGNVDVAWVNADGAYFTRSTDGGTTFSTPTKIPSDLSLTLNADDDIQMALDANGNINLLWRRVLTGTSTAPSNFFSRSADGGVTFSTPVNLSTTAAPARLAVQPTGNVVITWFDAASSNLIAETSLDGVTFSSPITVWTASGNPMDLTTAVGPQGQIYAFWTQMISPTNCSILISMSANALNFSAAKSISANSGSCNQTPAAFVDASGNVDVAWDADGTSLFFSRSTDAGANFTSPISVLTSARASAQQIAVGPDEMIYIAWASQNGSLFSHSTDNGATFSATPTVLMVPLGGSTPILGVDACSNISVAGGDGGKVTLQRSTDAGVTFSNPVTLSNLPNDFYPSLVLDKNGNVNVTWEVDGPPDIFYVRVPTTCSLH
jgi:hypothetical protein